MEFISKKDIKILTNEGFESHQLIFPENSKSERITITKVIVQPGVKNRRHKHDESEQVWIAVQGEGLLLLDNNETKKIKEGDVVRFEDGDIHGLENTSDKDFTYISVTSPPINFRYAYKGEK